MNGDDIELRPIVEAELDLLFEHQRDEEAHWRIAFTTRDPDDRDVFDEHWRKFLADETITLVAIVCRGVVVGHLTHFYRAGTPEIGYWLGSQHSGRGIATEALRRFLMTLDERPLFARAASDHIASLRVLEKCGFTPHAREVAHSARRGTEVEETIMILH